MLYFHNFPMILTARINIKVTKYHKDKAAKSSDKAFSSTRKYISRQERVFSPANCKRKLTGGMMKTKARLLQFQTHAKALELEKTRGLQTKHHTP